MFRSNSSPRKSPATILIVALAMLAASQMASNFTSAALAAEVPTWATPVVAPFSTMYAQGVPKIYNGTSTYVLFGAYTGPLEEYPDIYKSIENPVGTWSVPTPVNSLNTASYEGDTMVVDDTIYFLTDRGGPQTLWRGDWDPSTFTASSIALVNTTPATQSMGSLQAVEIDGEWRMYFTRQAAFVKYYTMEGDPWPTYIQVADLSPTPSSGMFLAEDGSFALSALLCDEGIWNVQQACQEMDDYSNIFAFLPGTGEAGVDLSLPGFVDTKHRGILFPGRCTCWAESVVSIRTSRRTRL